jgi:hypothetical protein
LPQGLDRGFTGTPDELLAVRDAGVRSVCPLDRLGTWRGKKRLF